MTNAHLNIMVSQMSRGGNRAVSMSITLTLDKLFNDIVKRFQLLNTNRAHTGK